MIRNEFNGIGRLGKDPIIRHTEGGNKVASFSIAISEKYKKDGQDIEKTEWVNIVCWNKTADIVEQWVKKGNLIAVKGKLQTRKYEKDSVTHYTTEIVANEIMMLGGKSQENSQESIEQSDDIQPEYDGDGLPF